MKIRYYVKPVGMSLSLMTRNPKNGKKSFIHVDNFGVYYDTSQPQLDKHVGDVLGKEVIMPGQEVQAEAKEKITAKMAVEVLSKKKKLDKKEGELEEV